jgi:hypothetical protein
MICRVKNNFYEHVGPRFRYLFQMDSSQRPPAPQAARKQQSALAPAGTPDGTSSVEGAADSVSSSVRPLAGSAPTDQPSPRNAAPQTDPAEQ